MSKKLLRSLEFESNQLQAKDPEKLVEILSKLNDFEDELERWYKKDYRSTTLERKLEIESLSLKYRELRRLALSKGGLLTNKLRKRSYLASMRYMYDFSEYCLKINFLQREPESRELIQKKYETLKIVTVDCKRSVLNQLFPPNTDRDKIDSEILELEAIIKKISKSSYLYYYQGLHDVTLYFHYILGNQTINFVRELCYLHLHEFTMEYSGRKFEYGHVLEIFNMVFSRSNPKLNKAMSKIAEEGYFYCCSLILTWFTHDSKKIDFIMRVFDYLVLSPPLTIYFLVASSLTNYVESNNIKLENMDSGEYFMTFNPVAISQNAEEKIDQIIELSEMYRKKFDFNEFKTKFETKILSQ